MTRVVLSIAALCYSAIAFAQVPVPIGPSSTQWPLVAPPIGPLSLANSAGYVPPTLNNNLFIAYGDSRTANGGGSNYATPVFTEQVIQNGGYSGWLHFLGGGNLIVNDWNYGVGSQTTAGIAGRVGGTPGVDCNSWSGSTVCLTGMKGTPTTSNGLTSFSFTRASGTAFTGTAYWNAQTNGNFACQATVTGTDPTYTVTMSPPPSSGLAASACITGTSGTVVLSPLANSSNVGAFVGASGVGATAQDVHKAAASQGISTPVSDPAQVVYILAGTNDSGLTNTGAQPQSLRNLAAMLDALGPSGANKRVVLANEVPRGIGNGFSVANTAQNGAPEVVTAAATNTLSQAATYWATQQVYYAPAGTGALPFVAGASDGTFLVNCTTGTTAAPNGTAGCTPAAGQYSVSSGGVLSFNAADVGKQIAVNYSYRASDGPNTYLNLINAWASSSAANFVYNAVNYNMPGALYNRPWVILADTWNATVDPACPAGCGGNYYPKAWLMGASNSSTPDGLHPQEAGGAVIANTMINAAKAAGAYKNTQPFPTPTVNNPWFTTATFVSTVGAFTPTDCAGQPNATDQRYWVTAMTPAVNTGLYGPTGPIASQPFIFLNNTTNLPAGTRIICIDQAKNALLMNNLSAGSNAQAGFIQLDAANLISDGVPTATATGQIQTTAITGCGAANVNCPAPVYAGQTITAGYPQHWTITLDANSQTAVNTAGTMAVRFGVATAPFSGSGDNADWFVVQLGGFVSSAGSALITIQQSVVGMVLNTISAGDNHRAMCDVKVGPGPNGHLTGLTSVGVKSTDARTGTFTPPGSTANTYSNWVGLAGGGVMQFTDGLIAAGAPGVSSSILTMKEITPISQAPVGTTNSNLTMSLTIAASKGDPVSATIWIKGCSVQKVTQ